MWTCRLQLSLLVVCLPFVFCAPANAQFLNDPYVVGTGGGPLWWSDAAYNPARNEYCMTWQNGYIIRWRRLDSTGAVLGSEYALADGVTQGHHWSTISYNSAQQEYLILYSGWIDGVGSHMRVLRVNASTGNQIGGTIWLDTLGTNSTTGGLDIAYSPTSNSYMAVYEAYNEGNIYSRRLDAFGNLVGSRVQIDPPSHLYSRNPQVAWNSVNNEYLVTYMGLVNGPSFDYWAQRVRASDGALLGSTLQLTTTGDIYNFGGVAYDSNANRYLVVYDGGASMPWGQLVSNTATLVGSRFAIGAGTTTGWAPHVAFDSLRREFLVSWSGNQTGTNYSRRVSQAGVCIDNAVSNTGAWEFIGIGNWPPRPVYNSVNDEFLIHWHNSYATILNRRYKSPITQTPFGGTPWAIPGTVQAENFDNGGESVAYHDLSAGNAGGQYRSTDVDIETTTDTGGGYNVGWIDTGEWLEYTVNVASAGSYNINMRVASCCSGGTFRVEMNGNNVTGSQSFASTGGWQTWTTKTVSNVSLSAGQQVLRVYVESGGWNLNYINIAQSAGPPGQASNPNPANGATGVSNSPSLSWTAGSGATSHDVRFGTANPPPFIQNQAGTSYSPGGLIGNTTYFWRIDEKNASGTTTGTVWSFTTTFCFSDAFAYANGNLNGNGSWTGSATSQIQIVSQTVKINGGTGGVDANRTISCTGTGGIIQVNVKVQAGTGVDTMWSLWFNDSAGVNICRWYGAGTTARGRIGSTGIVTASQTLTGGWDNLRVRINTTAKTAEFFFNGASIGTLDYAGQGAANTLGKLRFERINNSTTSGHFLNFDDLTTY